MELAWLEQLQLKGHHHKGSDDKHPDLIRKRKNIIRTHQRRKVGFVEDYNISRSICKEQQCTLRQAAILAKTASSFLPYLWGGGRS